MRAYGTPHALIFPIYGWSLTHIERSFFAALLKERGRGQLTGCFRPFLTCAKRRACGFSAGSSTLMRKIGFLLSFCGGVFPRRRFVLVIVDFSHPMNSWSREPAGTSLGSMVSNQSKAATSSFSSWVRWLSSGTASISGRA